ncbi:MAG: prephenate dehydrogenase/arogenate dehydrogenase family protein [Gammaproteobacteria bacterium]|nr:prephenate dehydrogenase/arogenate dehydrogenase family protein [Gammaproteobacteria bacterium]
MINRICIIGVGLIGGSLARALKASGACKEIVGTSLRAANQNSGKHIPGKQSTGNQSSANLLKAKQLNVIDRFETEISVAVKDADIVVVSVPVGAQDAIFIALADCVSSDTIITDVGSTKRSVSDSADKYLGKLSTNFVPAHPIAGIEKSGVEAASGDLFQQRRVIITPTENTSKIAVSVVQSMWEKTGAEVIKMDIDHHDEVLAATSHLPHLLAFSLVDTLSQLDEKSEIFKYAAGGFRDFTRIASSDPTMWHDICLANSNAILAVLETFTRDLKKLEQAIQEKDSQFILDVFVRAKKSRDTFCNEQL